MNAGFHSGEAAGCVGAALCAGLLEFADFPVLAVGEVPEADGVTRIEAGIVDAFLLEEPLAGDVCAIRGDRDEAVGHQVIGVEADEHVGPGDEVVDLLVVVFGGAFDELAAVELAIEGKGVVLSDDRHPATVPRALAGDPLAHVVGGDLVQLGMDAGAVVALGVVLDDGLPVGLDVVLDQFAAAEVGQVVALEVGGHVVEDIEERGGIVAEVDIDEALPGRDVDFDQAPFVEIEVLEHIGVAGFVKGAIEIVDPGVVGALEAGDLAAAILDEGGAAVTAEVEEGVDGVVLVADDDDVFAGEFGQEVFAGKIDIFLAADKDPAFGKPRFEFVFKDGGLVVDAGREELGRLGGFARFGDFRGGDR